MLVTVGFYLGLIHLVIIYIPICAKMFLVNGANGFLEQSAQLGDIGICVAA